MKSLAAAASLLVLATAVTAAPTSVEPRWNNICDIGSGLVCCGYFDYLHCESSLFTTPTECATYGYDIAHCCPLSIVNQDVNGNLDPALVDSTCVDVNPS